MRCATLGLFIKCVSRSGWTGINLCSEIIIIRLWKLFISLFFLLDKLMPEALGINIESEPGY